MLEITGSNVSTSYITCPADPAKTLGIKLPYLVLVVKNLKQYFSFEITVLDDKNVRRRFRASNFQVRMLLLRRAFPDESIGWLQRASTSPSHCSQSATRIKPFICTMPMRLDDGWNQVQILLADFVKRAYGG